MGVNFRMDRNQMREVLEELTFKHVPETLIDFVEDVQDGHGEYWLPPKETEPELFKCYDFDGEEIVYTPEYWMAYNEPELSLCVDIPLDKGICEIHVNLEELSHYEPNCREVCISWT